MNIKNIYTSLTQTTASQSDSSLSLNMMEKAYENVLQNQQSYMQRYGYWNQKLVKRSIVQLVLKIKVVMITGGMINPHTKYICGTSPVNPLIYQNHAIEYYSLNGNTNTNNLT